MNSRKIIEGLGPFKGGRHRPISPYAGSWADQEAKRPRVPLTPEQERQLRAGIVHPEIANAPVLKGYERTDAKGVPLPEGDSQFRRPSYARIDPFAGAQRGMDDMGLPVGPEGQRRFPTSAPDDRVGPGSTSGVLLGKAGYRQWARDMHERGEKVPTWDQGVPYPEEQDEDPYAKRVRELEAEGLTTSDAQAAADAEEMKARSKRESQARELVNRLVEAWQDRVQATYDSLEELESYDRNYGIARRLGFESAEALWQANPVIAGSSDPADLRVVSEGRSPANSVFEYALGGEPESKRVKLVQPLTDVECWNSTKGATATLPAGTEIEIQGPGGNKSTTIQAGWSENDGGIPLSDGTVGYRFIVPNDQLAAAIGREVEDQFDVVGQLMAFDEGELDREETIALFQHLVTSGIIKSIEGRYARIAQQLIDKGLVKGKRPER